MSEERKQVGAEEGSGEGNHCPMEVGSETDILDSVGGKGNWILGRVYFSVPKTSLGEIDVLLNHFTLWCKHNYLGSISMPNKNLLSVDLPSVVRMSDFPDFEYIRLLGERLPTVKEIA